MKQVLSLLVVASLILSIAPAVFAVSIGSGVGIDITTEDFAPLVWMCDNRVVYDDNTEPGRYLANLGNPDCKTYNGDQDEENDCELLERINNYAFEGEQISWLVLVMDKNKIDQNIDVYATIGDVQGEGNDIEVNCQRVGYINPNRHNPDNDENGILDSCNARILEEQLEWNEDTMDYFECLFTVETTESMYGEYWITVEAQDGDGLMGTMDENEYWFLNPEIALSVDGDLVFEDVRPGTDSYSDTILVGNEADDGSGVMLDMFISGTDFYDSSSSGARCPTTNQLALQNFRYYVTNGAYNSAQDMENDVVDGDRNVDAEGYLDIDYGLGFNNPSPFYDAYEILQAGGTDLGNTNSLVYYPANLLAPGAEMALTFKLSLPEPCNGDFDTGSLYFWGEAI